MDDLKYAGCMLAILLSGFIVGVNIAGLVGPSQGYEHSWSKVVFATVVAMSFSILGRTIEK